LWYRRQSLLYLNEQIVRIDQCESYSPLCFFPPQIAGVPHDPTAATRIGIVIGSTREGRFGEKPAHWIHEIAKQRAELAFDLIDLRDHRLPFFNEPRSPLHGPVNNEAARLWARHARDTRRLDHSGRPNTTMARRGVKERARLRL